tara:strand:- start:251 stop:532 length:282 start_codon:yes stop_codon:yes gene_type:complete
MIYQLPNGRIIHLSLEQYLDMSDQDIQELNCLGSEFTTEATDPFFKSALTGGIRERKVEKEKELKEEQEHEPNLTEITDIDKLADDYFHPDDI